MSNGPPWAQRIAKAAKLRGAVDTLRQWEADAQSTIVTDANLKAVVQALVNRLGILCGRLADLIENGGRL